MRGPHLFRSYYLFMLHQIHCDHFIFTFTYLDAFDFHAYRPFSSSAPENQENYNPTSLHIKTIVILKTKELVNKIGRFQIF